MSRFNPPSSRILTKRATLGPETKLVGSDGEQMVSFSRALQGCNLFSPGQKKISLQSALGLKFSFLSTAIKMKSQVKESPITSKTRIAKEATKDNNNEVADGHENEAQSVEGRPNCSLHKNTRFLAPAKQN